MDWWIGRRKCRAGIAAGSDASATSKCVVWNHPAEPSKDAIKVSATTRSFFMACLHVRTERMRETDRVVPAGRLVRDITLVKSRCQACYDRLEEISMKLDAGWRLSRFLPRVGREPPGGSVVPTARLHERRRAAVEQLLEPGGEADYNLLPKCLKCVEHPPSKPSCRCVTRLATRSDLEIEQEGSGVAALALSGRGAREVQFVSRVLEPSEGAQSNPDQHDHQQEDQQLNRSAGCSPVARRQVRSTLN